MDKDKTKKCQNCGMVDCNKTVIKFRVTREFAPSKRKSCLRHVSWKCSCFGDLLMKEKLYNVNAFTYHEFWEKDLEELIKLYYHDIKYNYLKKILIQHKSDETNKIENLIKKTEDYFSSAKAAKK